MSRTKDHYENSLWLKFRKWVDGETDLLADGMETRSRRKRLKGTFAGGADCTGGAFAV